MIVVRVNKNCLILGIQTELNRVRSFLASLLSQEGLGRRAGRCDSQQVSAFSLSKRHITTSVEKTMLPKEA